MIDAAATQLENKKGHLIANLPFGSLAACALIAALLPVAVVVVPCSAATASASSRFSSPRSLLRRSPKTSTTATANPAAAAAAPAPVTRSSADIDCRTAIWYLGTYVSSLVTRADARYDRCWQAELAQAVVEETTPCSSCPPRGHRSGRQATSRLARSLPCSPPLDRTHKCFRARVGATCEVAGLP